VPQYRAGFGPFARGFRSVPFGDVDALAAALSARTCAVLVEPIQGEGGIIVPPAGYLAAVSALCRERNVLFVADEIQTGLGRTGARFACDHEPVTPDVLILGKALGGGLYPVSAVLASAEIMSALGPGDHGSTFGGNPLAASIGIAALDVLEDERLAERAAAAGTRLIAGLRAIASPFVVEVRGRGLLVGVECVKPARRLADALLRHGVAAKDTHDVVLRITPPLVITDEEIDFLLAAAAAAMEECVR
jgi:ornithine--oxo-acid transaminase